MLILDAIIAMGHSLGLSIVAEGIERQEQVDRLGELGCDYGQGYFIGKPLTAKQVNDALAGLPYATTSGRTAITWLWERAMKDPPPEPALRRVTAEEIVEQRAATDLQPASPQPIPVMKIRAPVAPPIEESVEEAVSPPLFEQAAGSSAPPEVEPVRELAAEPAPPPSPRRRKKKRRAPALGAHAG
jgi:hypothetical protein